MGTSRKDTTVAAIRRARPTDATSIAKVHIQTWQVAYRGQLPDDLLDNISLEARTERWRGILERLGDSPHRVWVAEQKGDVVGFVNTGPTRDDDSDPSTTGEVYAIYVLPKSQGQGIGRALMRSALEEMRSQGFKDITLWVLETNARTLHFYKAAGWYADGATRDDVIGQTLAPVVRYRFSLPL